MATDFKMGFILLLLLFASFATEASLQGDGYKQCEHKVIKWSSSSMDFETDEDRKDELRDILFFLHVPRTGGRGFNHCMLQKLNLNSWDCSSSYDKLRFDPSETNCRLLSTHDDYSVMSKLPKERTSLITLLRNPVDRVLSTYEFSLEIASKFMKYTNLTSAKRMVRVAGSSNSSKSFFGVNTLDIWPWKYLVPLMKDDLCARRDARELSGQERLPTENPYDMEDFLMPLQDYIYDPVVRDLVHNGACFQIAGLTNNSYFEDAHEVRRCVMKYQNLGEYVLRVAKRRLDSMLFVGLTDKHKESASLFAKIVGSKVISRQTNTISSISQSQPTDSAKNASERRSLLADTQTNADNRLLARLRKQRNNTTYRRPNRAAPSIGNKDRSPRGNLTVEGLFEMYEKCDSSSKGFHSGGWLPSLRQITHGNFTIKTRGLVTEVIKEEIAALNRLDFELYNYAQKIFIKQQAMAYPESLQFFSWRFLIAALLLLLFVFLFVNARRKSSKIKL